MSRCISGDQRRADFSGQKRVFLNIDRANLGALGIGQNRQRHCAGDVILGIFGRGAHVDDVIKGQCFQVIERGERLFHAFVLRQHTAAGQSGHFSRKTPRKRENN
jgi:hypothetical protein